MKIKYSELKKMAKSYSYIDKILFCMENREFQSKAYKEKLKKCGAFTSKAKFTKIKKYILIYKTAFLHSLERMKKEDSKIVKEIYMKNRSVCAVSMEYYISEAVVYRTLKKFLLYFSLELMKQPRIIHPILLIIS